ncbi:uncharacterized protein I303_102370 [Kwoniella dejecticola CBS 10117]|uniref:D-glycerate 3-kinase n=1 Tax=Kwoniella dejecticola CBS 10117 TaxID=1296121 RepID=A0A1A6AB60_9TREE|nr:uncharacterized protein I303_01490 [Kwoniella dejecticola CBS 10117]OBR87288.1 hypothetical protein I303_01490 [Kwoniella dejecticola CBS 10117]
MSPTSPADTRPGPNRARLIADFIAKQRSHLLEHDGDRKRPLMVSMQGPQGAGKSTLASALVELLAESYKLRIAVASLDDFYLDRTGLDGLAQAYPNNKMLQGRGPPGTHDSALLARTLQQIHDHDLTEPSSVSLPIFDKSLFSGRGDRSQSTIPITPEELDVFLLEGWSLGFQSLPKERLKTQWDKGRTAKGHSWESVMQVNENLAELNRNVNTYFDCHVSITPLDLDYIYTWRLQQEHHMKRDNGGIGMTDDEVRLFVDRYMPCYELYGEEPVDINNLKLFYGPDREVVEVQEI